MCRVAFSQKKDKSICRQPFLSQKTADSLADFVYIDTQGSESSSEQDLEDQLMALGERWSVLCTWVQERSHRIETLKEELRQLEIQRLDITEWISNAESSLRKMEQESCRNPTEVASTQLKNLQVSNLPFF